jgi:hypothetical protein
MIKLTASQKRNLAIVKAAGPEGVSAMIGDRTGLTNGVWKLIDLGLAIQLPWEGGTHGEIVATPEGMNI